MNALTRRLRLSLAAALAAVALIAAGGCEQLRKLDARANAASKGDTPKAEEKKSIVTWLHPVTCEYTPIAEFTGRFEAHRTIQLQSRVTGYLDEICFEEGAFVKKGDKLFQIDARTYDAEVNKAEASVDT